jgi:hypothetical protein
VPWLKRLVAGFPSRRPGLEPRSGHVGFVVDKVPLGQVFSEYFGFLCQFSFHRLLHTHLPCGAGTIGPLVADVQNGLSLTPPQETKKLKLFLDAFFANLNLPVVLPFSSCGRNRSSYYLTHCHVISVTIDGVWMIGLIVFFDAASDYTLQVIITHTRARAVTSWV